MARTVQATTRSSWRRQRNDDVDRRRSRRRTDTRWSDLSRRSGRWAGRKHAARPSGSEAAAPASEALVDGRAGSAHRHFSSRSRRSRPCWLRRAVRNRHRHAIEQASRRWRGGRRDDSARARHVPLSISTLKSEPRAAATASGPLERCVRRARPELVGRATSRRPVSRNQPVRRPSLTIIFWRSPGGDASAVGCWKLHAIEQTQLRDGVASMAWARDI